MESNNTLNEPPVVGLTNDPNNPDWWKDYKSTILMTHGGNPAGCTLGMGPCDPTVRHKIGWGP